MNTVITKCNKIRQFDPDKVIHCVSDIGDCIVITDSGEIIVNQGNPITWPADASDGLQAIVDVNKAAIRFGVTNGIMQKYEYVVSTYGDSGTVPKPAPHIFDLINYWSQKYRQCLGTKDSPEGWMWQWMGDDWVLSNGTICLTRNDWGKYNDKQVADQPAELGTKADSGKPMMGCIPPHAELAVARVLTFGAQKYSRGNWAHVENSDKRYMDAALRHINAHRRGENTDSETGESHLAHAICCILFMLDKLEGK